MKNKDLSQYEKDNLTKNRYEYLGAELINLEKYENFYQSLLEHNRNIENAVQKKWNDIFVFIEEANEKKLGIYTEEQEADEMSLEFLSRLGISAEPIIKLFAGFRSLFGVEDIQKFPGTLSSKECMDAYNNGFIDFIPISDYYDSHHESCFRAYNLHREIKAHKDELAKIKVTTKKNLNPKLWQDLAKKIELDFPTKNKKLSTDK